MPGYIDNRYFGDISQLMFAKGFALFAHVQLSTDEGFKDHVGTKNARDTRLFFHYPNKALIVSLNYHESDSWTNDDAGKEVISGNWTIRFYHQFVSTEKLVRLTFIPYEERTESSRFGEFDDSFRKILFNGLEPKPTHFTWRGNAEMCELYPPKSPTSPATIMSDIEPIVDGLLPYLAALPFGELQVTNFPPYYTFPGCEEKFWEKFKASVSPSYLWSLAKKPWGSDNLRR